MSKTHFRLSIGQLLLLVVLVGLIAAASTSPSQDDQQFPEVYEVEFSSNGELLAALGDDGTIRIWSVVQQRQLTVLHSDAGEAACMAFSPDGRFLVAGVGKTVCLWDGKTWREIARLEGHADSVEVLKFSPDGKSIVSGDDHAVMLWNATTGEPRELCKIDSRISSIQYLPEGNAFVLASAVWFPSDSDPYGQVTRIDAINGDAQSVGEHPHPVTSIAVSANGSWLATGSQFGEVAVWDLHTGSSLQTMSSGRPLANMFESAIRIRSIAFSPDGETLAATTDQSTITLWDASSGSRKMTLVGHFGDVNSIAFSPDGVLLGSGSDDRTIRLWDVATGQQLAILGTEDQVHSSIHWGWFVAAIYVWGFVWLASIRRAQSRMLPLCTTAK